MKKDRAKTSLGGLESMLEGLHSVEKSQNISLDISIQVEVSRIKPNPHQPRQAINMLDSDPLVGSIKLHGVLQPILVRTAKDGYEIIAGERRWLASKLANKQHVPCVVKEFSDQEAQIIAMVENLQREELNPIDVANGLFMLSHKYGLTHESLSLSVGRSRSSISNFIRLLTLDPSIQECVKVGTLGMGHAKLLAGLSIALQKELARQVVNKELTVRQLESLIKKTTFVSKQESAKFNPKATKISLALQRRFGVKFKVAISASKQNVLYFENDGLLETFLQFLCEPEVTGSG